MQANGSLRRPLWNVIKSIGASERDGVQVTRSFSATQHYNGADASNASPSAPAVAEAAPHPRQPRRTPNNAKTPSQRTAPRRDGQNAADVRFRRVAPLLNLRKHGVLTPSNEERKSAFRKYPLDDGAPPTLPEDRQHCQHTRSQEAVSISSVSDGEQARRQSEDNASARPILPPLVRRTFTDLLDPEEEDSSVDKFEALIQAKIAGPTDHKLSLLPRLPADRDLKVRYFNAYRSDLQHRLMKQAKRWQRAKDSYGLKNARNWRSALELLDRATPDGDTRHKRRIETVKLGEGLHATWKMNAGEVVLEIMQRTGSHLQALPSARGRGRFQSISLWGTPQQNEHAKRIITQYVEAADEDQQPVNVYALNSEVVRDSAAAEAIFGLDVKDKTDLSYWREQDDSEDVEMELLADALSDITDAPPTSAHAPIRAVWAPSSVALRAVPIQWNQLTFSAYVEALTTPRTRLARRKLYGAQPPKSTAGHVENMMAELVRIFTEPEPSVHVSAHALDTAARYFMKYHNFPAARKVFLTLEDRGFDFTSSNYDWFCEIAAKEESVPNYVHVLRLMIRKGLRPTIRTWTAFHMLMARRFPLETNIVTEIMRRKGLLANLDTVKTVASGAVDRELAAYLSLKRSVTDFMVSMEARYGELATWLSTSLVNKMTRVLLERGEIEEATNLVRRLESISRGKGRQGADTATLNTFLASCMRGDNVDGAIAYLRLFMPPPPGSEDASVPRAPPIGRYPNHTQAIKPDQVTLAILFTIGWRQRCYNFTRAVWRHACARGMVSFKMQDSVRHGLERDVKWINEKPQSNDKEASDGIDLSKRNNRGRYGFLSDNMLFRTLAGKFIVGVGDGLPKDAPTDPDYATGDPLSYRPDLVTSEEAHEGLPRAEWTDPGGEQLKVAWESNWRLQQRLAHRLLRSDLDETGSVRPANSLLEDLERAWRLDVLWKEEGLGRAKRVETSQKAPEEQAEEAEAEEEKLAGKGKEKGDESGKVGKPKRKSLRNAILDMFAEMLQRGVRVPMVVGDAADVRGGRELPGVRYKP